MRADSVALLATASCIVSFWFEHDLVAVLLLFVAGGALMVRKT